MFPYYIKPIEADNKISLLCCGSKTTKLGKVRFKKEKKVEPIKFRKGN